MLWKNCHESKNERRACGMLDDFWMQRSNMNVHFDGRDDNAQ